MMPETTVISHNTTSNNSKDTSIIKWISYSDNIYNYTYKLPAFMQAEQHILSVDTHIYNKINTKEISNIVGINSFDIGFRTSGDNSLTILKCATDMDCYNNIYKELSSGIHDPFVTITAIILNRKINGIEIVHPPKVASVKSGTVIPAAIDLYYNLPVNQNEFVIHFSFSGYSTDTLRNLNAIIDKVLQSIIFK